MLPQPFWKRIRERAGKPQMILAFQIPEAPYSDRLFQGLHHAFEITDGVIATTEIFGEGLLVSLGLAGLGLTVLGPLAAFFGSFMALGAATAEARAEIARERVKMGFAEGVVVGADRAPWRFAKSLFWQGSPGFNAFDEEAGRIAQKAYNLGFAAGFVQGSKLSEAQKHFFWQSLSRDISDVDRAQFSGDHKRWQRLQWIDYYIFMAAKFIKLYVKD